MHVAYFLGQQRAVSGTLLAEHGSFFGGKKTGFGYRIARVAMSPQVSLEPNVMFHWVDLPQGNFTTTLISTRATYTLTPRMYIAALFQYNSNDDAVSNNFRLRWEYRPGSELFVVYSDERLTTDRFTDRLRYPGLESRSFVVKINRLLRF